MAPSFCAKLTMANINNKIKELQSRWGGEPVYSKIPWVESACLFVSRWHYTLTSGLYHQIKYFVQRHTRGFDDLDKWNAAWYISRKAVPVLTAWRNSHIMGTAIKRHIESRHGEIIELDGEKLLLDDAGHPASFTIEEWKAIIDDIIFAFNFIHDEDAFSSQFVDTEAYVLLSKRYKRGMRLFSIYYMSLWD